MTSVVRNARSRRKPISRPLIEADQSADADRRRDSRRHRPLRDVDQRQSGDIGERECRADAQIDAAAQHDDRHADDDQSEFADLPRRVGQIPEAT